MKKNSNNILIIFLVFCMFLFFLGMFLGRTQISKDYTIQANYHLNCTIDNLHTNQIVIEYTNYGTIEKLRIFDKEKNAYICLLK